MKKLIALTLILTLALGAAACTTQTDQPPAPGETGLCDIPPTEVTATQPPHTHAHTSRETKAPTCTQAGTLTFTCTCGDTYQEDLKATGHSYGVIQSKKATCTEPGYTQYACPCGSAYTKDIPATGHKMTGWQDHAKGGWLSPSEKRNTCQNCGQYESQLGYDSMFSHYAEIAGAFGFFSDPQQLQQELETLINTGFWTGAITPETTFDETTGIYTHTIAVSAMDAFTRQYLGTTFDYTGIDHLNVLWEAHCDYDPETNSLVITAYPIGNDTVEYTRSIRYTTEDNVHFTVTVTSVPSWGETCESTMTVLKSNDSYIITSHTA